MRYPINILEVGALQPDFMGFIFYNESPRFVTDTFRIPIGLSPSVKRVGVFVNEPVDRVLDAVNKHELDYVQLHGDEPVGLCENLRAADVKIIKVFSIDHEFDFKRAIPFKEVADFFLFDTKGLYRGGNAASFDWRLLQRYDQEVPFFLSGGISLTNIEHALQLKDLNLYGIDVNSGVELNPGVKDVERIEQLLRTIKHHSNSSL